jgi:uncharacterized protein (TIGR00251 family)
MTWLSSDSSGVVINLRVAPRASKNEICGESADALRIRLQAPPVEGKANKALERFLAKALGVPARNVTILKGETSRRKRVRIEGVTEQDVRRLVTGAIR